MHKEPYEDCNEYPSNKDEHKSQQTSGETSNNGICRCSYCTQDNTSDNNGYSKSGTVPQSRAIKSIEKL